MQTGGYIKIYRKILQWEWWDDPIMLKTWMYILLTATHKEIRWMGAVIPRGCFVTTQRKLAIELGVSRRTVQKNLKRLVKSGNITTKVNHDNTIIIICNYDSYQSEDFKSEPQSSPQGNPLSSPQDSPLSSPSDSPLSNPISSPQDSPESSPESNPQSSPTSTPQGSPQSSPYNKNNKNKKNNSSSNAPVRACACEEVDVNDLAEWLRTESGESWKEVAMMQLGIRSLEALNSAFEDYQSECILQGVEWKDAKDIRSHFTNMMRIVQKKEKQNKNGNTRGNIQHTDTRDLVAVAKGMLEYEKGMEGGD